MSAPRRLHKLHHALLVLSARFGKWLGDDWTLLILGAVVGVITGALAVAFVELVRLLVDNVWGGGHGLGQARPGWFPLLVVPVGMLAVSWFTRTFAPEAAGHGVPEVMEAIALRHGRMRARVGWIKLAASSVSIGLGGSVGKEGPIVQAGSAFGAMVGRFFVVKRRRMRTLVGCGSAAGIAAVFNAPVGGVMFALEIIIGRYEVKSFSPILIASVLGAVTSRRLLGEHPSFDIPPALREGLTMATMTELVAYALLGLLLGLASVAFIRVLAGIEDFAEGVRWPWWSKSIVAGLAVGALGLALPDVLGEGHHTMSAMLLSNAIEHPWLLLLALGAVKLLATATTIGGGGSGGVFAPSLFVGAALGGAFGQLLGMIFPGAVGGFGAYALAGMAGVLAGTAHAPLTGILLLFEMSDNYLLILPLMITSVLSSLVAQRLLPDSIYTLKLSRRGIVLNHHQDEALLRSLRVADAMGPPVETIPATTSFDLVVRRLLRSEQHDFPVVDATGRLVGTLSLDDVREFLREDHLDHLLLARDCAHRMRTLAPQDSLLQALDAFESEGAHDVPVVMGEQLVGSLHRADVWRTYRKALTDQTHNS